MSQGIYARVGEMREVLERFESDVMPVIFTRGTEEDLAAAQKALKEASNELDKIEYAGKVLAEKLTRLMFLAILQGK